MRIACTTGLIGHKGVPMSSTGWCKLYCPCGKSHLCDLLGRADIAIRRHCRRCKAWWIIDCRTLRIRGATEAELPFADRSPGNGPREPVVSQHARASV